MSDQEHPAWELRIECSTGFLSDSLIFLKIDGKEIPVSTSPRDHATEYAAAHVYEAASRLLHKIAT